MIRSILLFCGFAVIVFATSCNNDDTEITPVTEPDFSINSSEYFKIDEKYDNGWIKSARRVDYLGKTEYEVVYHPNGYLAEYKVYHTILSDGLKMEHSRNDSNQPLQSKYYDLNGNLYASLLYENGLLNQKKIYGENTTTTFLYDDGSISSINKVNTQTGTTASALYDYTQGLRQVEVSKDDGTVYNIQTSIDGLGSCYASFDDMSLANITDGNVELKSNNIYTSLFSSVNQEYSITPIDLLGATSLYYYVPPKEYVTLFGYSKDFATIKSTLNDFLFRNIAEQYPFTEGAIFIGYSEYYHKNYTGISHQVLNEKLNEYRASYGDDFELLYGDSYVRSYVTGKLNYYIATLRNLPTDPDLKEEIVDIAQKHTQWIVTGNNEISEEKREMLDRVFYEFKVHSSTGIDQGGIVVNNLEEFDAAIAQINEAEHTIIQQEVMEFY